MPSLTRLLVALTVSLVVQNSALAVDWWVSPCGSDAWTGVNAACAPPHGPKRTIQAAIAVASDGDTINVLPGTYPGDLDTAGKAVHIVGIGGSAVTTVDCLGSVRGIVCDTFEGPDTIIEGLTFLNGYSASSGGGAWLDFASPTFIDCVFDSCHAEWNGGGVAIEIASPEFNDCRFVQNTCDFSGAGVSIQVNGYPVFNDCHFESNDAVGNGGGLYAGSAHPTLNGCYVNGNEGIRGGGIGVGGGSLAVNGLNVDDNNAHWLGGGIYCQGADVTINVGAACDNTADDGGGAMTFSQCDVSITGFVMQGNSTNDYAGALYAGLCTITMSQCAITSNTATSRGGGISLYECDAVLGDMSFSTNDATPGDGGGLWIRTSTATLSDVTFSGNTCSTGGGLWADDATIALTGGSFVDNVVGWEGGGLYAIGSSVSVTDSLFDGNTAATYGAATKFTDLATPVIFDGCTFTQNHADITAGAVHLQTSSARIANSNFIENTGAYSGAIRCTLAGPDEFIELRACQFQANAAHTVHGGVMHLGPNYAGLVTGCDFIGNSAATDGGVIHCQSASLHMSNSQLRANTASNGGGINFEGDATAVIANTLLTENHATTGGALFVGTDTTLEMINCTSTLNTAIAGGRSLTVGGDAIVEISNSIFHGDAGDPIHNSGTVNCKYSIVPAAYAGPGCMSVDPMFVDAAGGDFTLDAASPCIDAGHTWSIPTDLLDVDGDGDTAERIDIDLAGNTRVMDAGGCGPGSVDIGAYEHAGGAVTPVDGDLDGDGIVNTSDLLVLIGQWGAAGCPVADLNGDGQVDTIDLLILLGEWS